MSILKHSPRNRLDAEQDNRIMLMRTQVMQLHPGGGDVPHWEWVEKLEKDYEHYQQIFQKDYPTKAEPSLP